MGPSLPSIAQYRGDRRGRLPYHPPSIVRVLFILFFLLFHAAPFSIAWKFRWARNREVSERQQQVLVGGDEAVGDPHSRSTNQQAPQHNTPGSNTEPLTVQQQQQQQQQQEQQRHWFSWGSATSFSPFELAEDTMEEAVGILKDVVAVVDQYWLPPVAVRAAIGRAIQNLKAALLFQPPVGFVTTLVLSRLILGGRLFRRRNTLTDHESVEDELLLGTNIIKNSNSNDSKNDRLRGRSLLLDGDDHSYITYGGIERIRRRLCLAAVEGLWMVQQQQQHNEASTAVEVAAAALDEDEGTKDLDSFQSSPVIPPLLTEAQQEVAQAAVQALSVTFRPTGSRLRLVREMMEPVSRLEGLVLLRRKEDTVRHPQQPPSRARSAGGPIHREITPKTEDDKNSSCGISAKQLDQVLYTAAQTAQVRAMDTLLRLCRDRLLQTTYRLARVVEHLHRRVQQTRRWSNRWQHWLRPSIEADRLQLSLAVAAYNAEVTRLGQVTAVLMERPAPELSEQAMIQALKATEERAYNSGPSSSSTPTTTAAAATTATVVGLPAVETATPTIAPKAKQLGWYKPWSRLFSSSFSLWNKYSLWWKADYSKGFLSIRKFDAADGYIDMPSAVHALLYYNSDETLTTTVSDKDWTKQAQAWTASARNVICQAVQGCLQGSTHQSLTKSCSEADFRILRDQWCSNDAVSTTQSGEKNDGPVTAKVQDQWRSIIHYVDQMPSWRRIGEGQKIRLRDAFRFMDLYKRNWDPFGIPSSLLLIYASTLVHERFVIKYWATVRREIVDVSLKLGEIFRMRAWDPLKGIYDDIMNKSPSMMSALGLDVEESSLDHMLRDLGFGDGTSATRERALMAATEQYERDLSSGLFSNFVKGRLVRLMLVQVQQLKVGLLSALDTIDVLIQGNRIHFKVLAAIPAVVIATYGTRYLMRVLYNFRAKDIRPVSVVHAEMSQYLTKIENLLLLSEQVDLSKENKDETVSRPSPQTQNNVSSCERWATALQPAELGEIILNMHRYLILLDFSSPPFPTSNCDKIHSSLQKFLGTEGTLKRLDADRQILWLSRIKQDHQDLVKAI